jgi:succinate semialdehyde reductase (NADPH)
VIGVDVIDEKLKIAKELGADMVINAREKDSAKGIREITKGGVDVAFEFIGLSETISNAVNSVKRGGRAVIVGVTSGGPTIPIPIARVVGSGLQILGNYGGRPRIDLPAVFELTKRELINIDKLVTAKYRLEQINEAFEDLEKGKILGRSILVFE